MGMWALSSILKKVTLMYVQSISLNPPPVNLPP